LAVALGVWAPRGLAAARVRCWLGHSVVGNLSAAECLLLSLLIARRSLAANCSVPPPPPPSAQLLGAPTSTSHWAVGDRSSSEPPLFVSSCLSAGP